MATSKPLRGDKVTPILESMNSFRFMQNSTVTTPPQTDSSAEKEERREKKTSGQTVKGSADNIISMDKGVTSHTDPDNTRSQSASTESARQTTGNEKPVEKESDTAMETLLKINSTLDAFGLSLKGLTGSMGNLSKEMTELKQKQDFLEASWQDPDFEYSYDPKQGSFQLSQPVVDLEDGELGQEPPSKKAKQDGEPTPSSSKASDQVTGNQPIASMSSDATPRHGGNLEKIPAEGLLGNMKRTFKMEENITTPINEGLAALIDEFLSRGCAPESLEKMKYPRPSNIEFLQRIKVNQSLWSTFSKNVRMNDVKFQSLHESVILGLTPVIEVANLCLEKSNAKETLVNIEEIFDKLKDSIAVLTDTCHKIGMMRKQALKPNMKEQYRTLCGQNVDITTELFGDNLSTAAKDLGEINKLANIITVPDRNFSRGRSSGYRRGRGNRGGRGGYQNFLYQGTGTTPPARGRGAPRRPGGFRGQKRGAV